MNTVPIEQQIENLKVLIAAVEAQPELNLKAYRTKHGCGTLFCVAGLLPTIPHFKNLGVETDEMDGRGAPAMPVKGFGIVDTVAHLFGYYGTFDSGGLYQVDAFHKICLMRGQSKWDDELKVNRGTQWCCVPDTITDKDLALHRLNKALAIREAEYAAL